MPSTSTPIICGPDGGAADPRPDLEGVPERPLLRSRTARGVARALMEAAVPDPVDVQHGRSPAIVGIKWGQPSPVKLSD